MLVEWSFGAFLASGVMAWRGDIVHRFNIAGSLPFLVEDLSTLFSDFLKAYLMGGGVSSCASPKEA